jgi:predicted phosphodiesterase
MRLHILSDLHLEFGAFAPPKADADVVILAGDTHLGVAGIAWARKTWPNKPVIYIAGNHEFYREFLPGHIETLRRFARKHSVHFLENEAVTIGGITFLGCTLWTDFALFKDPASAMAAATRGMMDYGVIRRSLTDTLLRPSDTARMHAESVAWLSRQCEKRTGENLVIITHHAPSFRSVADDYTRDVLSASFASALDGLVERSGASVWVHGHVHDSVDYTIGSTRVLANPRGYEGVELNPQFNPGLVITV